jgi:hypothetical protein
VKVDRGWPARNVAWPAGVGGFWAGRRETENRSSVNMFIKKCSSVNMFIENYVHQKLLIENHVHQKLLIKNHIHQKLFVKNRVYRKHVIKNYSSKTMFSCSFHRVHGATTNNMPRSAGADDG